MKKYIIWFLTVWCCSILFGQGRSPLNTIINSKQQEAEFPSYNLLQIDKVSKQAGIDKVFWDATLFQVNESSRSQLLEDAPENLELSLTTSRGNMSLLLTQQQVLTDDFSVVTSDNDQRYDYTPGLYYRGIIDGDPNSFAAVSIFGEEIIAIIFPKGKEAYIVGKVNNSTNRYIGYYESDLIPDQNFKCETDESMIVNHDFGDLKEIATTASNARVNNCVNVYLELEHDLILEKGIFGAINYITGLWNIVALLYQNENITTNISEIFTWTTPDNYPTSSASGTLHSFLFARPNFNGDLAHLVSRGAPTGGGVAYLNTLCTPANYAYSWIAGSYNNFPTYSWSVNVLAHEMGHNLGAHHTHDCVWNGNSTALDGCGPTAGYGGSPGGCPTAPLPGPGQGTTMSYCNLLSNVGIGLSYGFGIQPGNRIRSRIANASCLESCGGGCPTDLTLSGTVNNTLNFEASNDITSTHSLTSSSTVDYQAGNLIIMKPGFIAQTGSDFRAHIDACQSFDGESPEETALSDDFPETYAQRTPDELPSEVDLRCMPNPFSTETMVEYRLTENGNVDFHLFDLNGRLLHTINQGEQSPGVYQINYKPDNLPSGVYYLRMYSGESVKTTKMILSK